RCQHSPRLEQPTIKPTSYTTSWDLTCAEDVAFAAGCEELPQPATNTLAARRSPQADARIGMSVGRVLFGSNGRRASTPRGDRCQEDATEGRSRRSMRRDRALSSYLRVPTV